MQLKYAKISFKNFFLVKKSKLCVCYHCLDVYKASKVPTFIDENLTAVCPTCGVDAVLPDAGAELPSRAEVEAYHTEMFGKTPMD